jgi:hypothetical protein
MANTGTRILKCGCDNPYQDARYGVGNRVHNGCDDSKHAGWRCTSCKTERAG